MSHTKKTHDRFWSAMGERFGKRWLDDYGTEPTLAWRELLDRYHPKVVKAALDLMHARAFEHPPTEPQFAELLATAAARTKKAEDTPEEIRRGYWRSTIIHQVAQDLQMNVAAFEPFLIENKHSLGASMRHLLDEICDLEHRTGQHTPGMDDTCTRRCHEIVIAFKSLKAAA